MLETIKQLLGLNKLTDSTEVDKTLTMIIGLTTDRLGYSTILLSCYKI